MDVSRFLNRQSTIFRRTESDDVDEYGNPVDGEPTSETVRCYFASWGTQYLPTSTEENVQRATTSDDWVYIVPAGTELASIDYVTIDGESGTFEVVGEPDHAWNPLTASAAYVTARLRRTQR